MRSRKSKYMPRVRMVWGRECWLPTQQPLILAREAPVLPVTTIPFREPCASRKLDPTPFPGRKLHVSRANLSESSPRPGPGQVWDTQDYEKKGFLGTEEKLTPRTWEQSGKGFFSREGRKRKGRGERRKKGPLIFWTWILTQATITTFWPREE